MELRAIGVTALLAFAGLAGCSAGTDAAPSPSTPAASLASASASATASPTPTELPGSAPFEVTDQILGMHVAGAHEGAWPDRTVPVGSLRLWDVGTTWAQVETTPGRYDWRALDNALANAERHKVDDVLLVLGPTPSWNASRLRAGDYPVPGAASMPEDVQAWVRYVRAVVKRYAGRITAYQIWNEASLTMFWDGTPEQMADLTERAARIIKDADPDAVVVAASTTLRLGGAFDRFFPAYLAALGQRGWPVDAFAVHLYPASRGTPDDRAAFMTTVREELAAAGAPDLPVWDTELNYGLAGPGSKNPRQRIAGEQATDWVVQTMLDSLHLGIARTYWYIWTPEPYPLLGMQLTDGSAAARGLRTVREWVVDASWLGCTDSEGVIACDIDRDGERSTVAWAKFVEATYQPPAGLAVQCDVMRECTPVTGPVTLTGSPVLFRAS